jgi:exopolysaccharide biosynthesis protein
MTKRPFQRVFCGGFRTGALGPLGARGCEGYSPCFGARPSRPRVGAASLSCLAALGLSSAVAQAATIDSAGRSTTPVTPYSWPRVLSERSTRPVSITDGISYSQTYYETKAGDAHAFVLNVNLGDPNVTLVPQLTTGALASEGATLSSTITRTGAVAGVNGDYFDRVGYVAKPAGDGQPTHMLIEHGQIVASGIPDDCGVVGYTRQGTVIIGRESFSGTVTSGSISEPLSALNEVVWPDSTSECEDKVGSPGLVLETPQWGARSALDQAAPVALLGDLGDGEYQVLSITAGATESPALRTGESALIGYGASDTFVDRTLQVGQVISVADSVSPFADDLDEAFGGGFLAVVNGEVNPEIAGNNSDIEAATVIGVTEDGRNLIVGVFDGGQRGEEGIGYSEMAGWLLQQGAYEGIVMDNGGSSEIDARLPGDTESSVLNRPSGGHQRLLAECVCFYTTEKLSPALLAEQYRQEAARATRAKREDIAAGDAAGAAHANRVRQADLKAAENIAAQLKSAAEAVAAATPPIATSPASANSGSQTVAASTAQIR